jgi:hypothetical protein
VTCSSHMWHAAFVVPRTRCGSNNSGGIAGKPKTGQLTIISGLPVTRPSCESGLLPDQAGVIRRQSLPKALLYLGLRVLREPRARS